MLVSNGQTDSQVQVSRKKHRSFNSLSGECISISKADSRLTWVANSNGENASNNLSSTEVNASCPKWMAKGNARWNLALSCADLRVRLVRALPFI